MCEHLSWSIEWRCSLLYVRTRCSHASTPGRFIPLPAIVPLGWFSPPPFPEFSLIINYSSWFVKPPFAFQLISIPRRPLFTFDHSHILGPLDQIKHGSRFGPWYGHAYPFAKITLRGLLRSLAVDGI